MATIEATSLVVVSDAGPLIHLDELGCLDILDFPEVQVPEAVWNEVTRHRPTALAHPAVRFSRQTDIPSSPRVSAVTPLFGLHHGEREALALCLARPGARLLTDDAAARLAAETLDVMAHGTLGLILRSVRRRLRSPEQGLQLLADVPGRSTLHIRPALLSQIIQQAASEWQKPGE